MNTKDIRKETPGCDNLIHFNNAGSSIMPNCVIEAMEEHLKLEQKIGAYSAERESVHLIDQLYSEAAKLINAKPDEIAYVENATRAWDMVFYGLPFQKGDNIITAQAEHSSNYVAMLQVAKRHSLDIHIIPNNEYGEVDVEKLKQTINEKTKLIAVTHIPTNNGLINPVKEVGQIAKEKNILFLLDACQSLGHIPVDVMEIGCDFLVATGRKYLRAPRGTGLLYVRSKPMQSIEPAFLDIKSVSSVTQTEYTLREDAKRYECWESNVAAKIGLGYAIKYLNSLTIKETSQRVLQLADYLRSELSQIEGTTVLDRGRCKSGIVTFIASKSPLEIHTECEKMGIHLSISNLTNARLDNPPYQYNSVLRASLHYFNTKDEIDKFTSVLKKILLK